MKGKPHLVAVIQVIMTTTDTSSESVVTSGQHQHSPPHPSQEWSLSQYVSNNKCYLIWVHHWCSHPPICISTICRLSTIAEKTLADFLAKATSSVVDGIPLPGMKVKNSYRNFLLTNLCMYTYTCISICIHVYMRIHVYVYAYRYTWICGQAFAPLLYSAGDVSIIFSCFSLVRIPLELLL